LLRDSHDVLHIQIAFEAVTYVGIAVSRVIVATDIRCRLVRQVVVGLESGQIGGREALAVRRVHGLRERGAASVTGYLIDRIKHRRCNVATVESVERVRV
jgi:hypothetical protein